MSFLILMFFGKVAYGDICHYDIYLKINILPQVHNEAEHQNIWKYTTIIHIIRFTAYCYFWHFFYICILYAPQLGTILCHICRPALPSVSGLILTHPNELTFPPRIPLNCPLSPQTLGCPPYYTLFLLGCTERITLCVFMWGGGTYNFK